MEFSLKTDLGFRTIFALAHIFGKTSSFCSAIIVISDTQKNCTAIISV